MLIIETEELWVPFCNWLVLADFVSERVQLDFLPRIEMHWLSFAVILLGFEELQQEFVFHLSIFSLINHFQGFHLR